MNLKTQFFASRLSKIPPYLFAELDKLKLKYQSTTEIIDFGEGNPTLPPHPHLLNFLRKSLNVSENHRYPTYQGKLSVREAISKWYKERFNVTLDPETEVAVLIGSKEGVAHLFWALVDRGDKVYVPSPSYPVYLNQTYLAGGIPILIPIMEKNRFLPELTRIKFSKRSKLFCLNYPNNPTGAVAPYEFYNEIVNLALKYNFYCFNDNVYSEIYYTTPPHSILEIPGAKECCVEFHSLSKTFSICGWRIGFVVGNADMIQALLKVKQNVDSGPFGAIQDSVIFALNNWKKFSKLTRQIYKENMLYLSDALNKLGWSSQMPEATFYLWCKIPFKQFRYDSLQFATFLLKNTGILVTPGIGFGKYGEGYVRFAVVLPKAKIKKAIMRLKKLDYKT
ncbi:MAG: aminotransferase class I/II-fold pyridoxal phosphate-dependent enzyme [candidate division WOR-3 bacterium]|nr:aminotransferase class I/II-fold pyridoxal phosphate-dependent enzyme [candidate division WOR-3 bacterium]MCX7757206.1 aminotransferase class I/II-fold pyridoxal phosphate-dependent enzyme [candidate division WOR-3 bacterium]MDW7987932.1 aminotransferase class I/II-fold pyridoxal phosphate-dependent enzyme [candidate division WOR-3 bacterium]